MSWLRCCYALWFAVLTVNVAQAEMIPLTGSITVKEAIFTPNFPVEANAYSLSPVNVSVTNATPELCSISGTKAQYNSGALPDCVVEWTELPAGQTNYGASVGGQYKSVGEQKYTYTVSVFNDGLTTSEVISSGTISVNAMEPRPSVVTSINYSGTTGFGNLLNNQVFLTDTDMPMLTLNVEARGYDQEFVLNGSPTNMSHSWSSCTVPAGATSCSDAYAQVHNTEYGREALAFDFQCGGDCGVSFPTLGSGVTAIYEWDFRPPLSAVIEGRVRSQGVIELSPIVANLRLGETFTLASIGTPNGATATVTGDGQKINFTHTNGGGALVSFSYKLETSQGRTVNGYARVDVIQDLSLPRFRMPSLPSGEVGHIQYETTGSARGADGTPLEGTFAGTLKLAEPSDTDVRVDGTDFTPGQAMPVALKFVGGAPVLGLRALSTANTMSAELVFSPTDPSLPRVKMPLQAYTVTATLNLPDTAVAGLQNVVASVTSSCSIVDEANAMGMSNACFVEFTLPAGMSRSGSKTAEGIVGSGTHSVDYKVGFFTGGQRLWLATGSKSLSTTDPVFNYVLHGAPIDRLAIEQHITLMDNTSNPAFKCVYYDGEKVETQVSTLNSGRVFCHVEWVNLPAGYTPQARSPNMLSGRLESSQDASFHARITAILPGGVDIVIHNQPITPQIIEPIIPDFDIKPLIAGEKGEYGYTLGHPRIRVDGSVQMNGDVKITTYLNGQEIGYTMPTFSGAIRDLVAPEAMPVGKTVTLTVRASYRTAPDVYTEQEIKAVAIPPNSIRPAAVSRDGFNDVDDANLEASIQDISWACRMSECPYDISSHGKWEIYLGQYKGYRDAPERISTSFATNAQGIATIPYMLTTDRQRYVLVADFISDEGSLIDTRESPPVIFEVLKKSEFAGEITTQRVSGEAPLSMSMRFTMDDKKDMAHVRNVKWQVQTGSGWENVADTPGRRGLFLRRVFEEGVYQVRAIVTNPAGIDTYSETLTVEAYNLPDVELVGSTYLLPGTTQEYSLEINGTPADSNEWIINWETDEFDTLDSSSLSLSSEKNHRTRVRYRAHLRRYPDDPRAGVVGTATVIWDTPRYVKYRFEAPREVWDTGQTYTLSANPYADRFGLTFMGEWTLPDGSIVPGTSIAYKPLSRAYGQQMVSFRGWFEEWPSAEREARVRILHLSDLLPKISVKHDYTEPLQAPVDAFFRVDVDRRLSSSELEKIDTVIDVADGQVTYDAGIRFGAKFTTGGQKTIKAVWKDENGDQVQGVTTIDVLPPQPLAMTLAVISDPETIVKSGSAWVVPEVTGLASNDQLKLYSGALDGQPWPITHRFGKVLYPIPKGPGSHTIKLVANTKYGYLVEGTAVITIP